ncbi:hypothetical protein JRQ81_002375 [Phrynocephalus forsythii]|uniref:Uncharacterized protein n=1 Tax=Phrynocephalus forsythii TaxID=171643 RepID=A0A9Q1AWM2_9SAUR|nr:hypothetical protein JRQ81_002375 [Phrynocephalus forsythii]
MPSKLKPKRTKAPAGTTGPQRRSAQLRKPTENVANVQDAARQQTESSIQPDLKNIIQAIENLSQKLVSFNSAVDMQLDKGETEPPHLVQPAPSDSNVFSCLSSERCGPTHRGKKKRKAATAHKSKKWSRRDTSSSLSSTESSSDEEGKSRSKNYWGEAACVPRLPRWALHKRALNEKLGRQAELSRPPKALQCQSCIDAEDPPGLHLTRRVRKAILGGHYIDLFSLARNDRAETRVRSKCNSQERPTSERTFDNRLEGFGQYAAVVQAAYPERAWHLNNHFLNVLKARKLASDAAALRYDEEFRKKVSTNKNTRWDLINQRLMGGRGPLLC